MYTGAGRPAYVYRSVVSASSVRRSIYGKCADAHRASIVERSVASVSVKVKKEKNMYKTYTMELAGRTLKVEIGKVGKQANGCAFMQYGDRIGKTEGRD